MIAPINPSPPSVIELSSPIATYHVYIFEIFLLVKVDKTIGCLNIMILKRVLLAKIILIIKKLFVNRIEESVYGSSTIN
jgi:hypothetical protein